MTRNRPVVAVCVSVATAFVLSACSAPAPPAEPMAAAPDRAADEAAIRALLESDESAFNARDFERFAASYAPDSDLISQDGPKVTGRAAIRDAVAATWAELPAERRIDITVDSIRFLAGDVAVVDNHGVFTTTDSPSEEPAGRATCVAVRNGDEWQWAAVRIYADLAEQ